MLVTTFLCHSSNFALPLSTNMPGSMERFDEAYSQDASARGWGSTSHYQRQGRSNVSDNQSGSNAPTEPSSSNAPAEKDKQVVDSGFILSKKLELGQEYEEMDKEYSNIRKMSRGGQAEDAAWVAFEARLDKCRAMQKEIRNARGVPEPIPEWFLLGRDFVRLKNLELAAELKSAVKSHKEAIEMSGKGHASAAETASAWAAFKDQLNRCRAIQRQIREAKGVPLPMPDELLDYQQ